jgi:hypothetical protein
MIKIMNEGNFFPPEYKQFPFKEGDLLIYEGEDRKFSVTKILKVDRIEYKEGSIISIQGQKFTATEDDYLLVVSAAYGASEFKSADEATKAALSGKWTVIIGHTPNRTPGAASGQVWVGNEPVTESELTGYKMWREAFDKGEAGIF